jgi:hypothetical protein
MRHLVLALMILLLPLRGWAGDAMATQMASAAVAIESGAARTHEIEATATFDHQHPGFESAQAIPDCHGQMASHSDAHDNAANDHAGTCQACQACQACHTFALSPSPVVVTNVFASPPLPPTPGAAFTSAAAALTQKPPIS